ncbi:MAG: hypothetical protein NVS4B1_37210 [Ktedonobacteraceae bacterium]
MENQSPRPQRFGILADIGIMLLEIGETAGEFIGEFIIGLIEIIAHFF